MSAPIGRDSYPFEPQFTELPQNIDGNAVSAGDDILKRGDAARIDVLPVLRPGVAVLEVGTLIAQDRPRLIQVEAFPSIMWRWTSPRATEGV